MPWEFGWGALGVIFTAILSVLLIIQNIRLNKKQDELQNQINKTNLDFNGEQAKISQHLELYQYRIKSYLSILEVCADFLDTNIIALSNLLKTKNPSSDLFDRCIAAKKVLFKAYHEAAFLFNEVTFDLLRNYYNALSVIVEKISNVYYLEKQDIDSISVFLASKKITNWIEYHRFFNDPANAKEIQNNLCKFTVFSDIYKSADDFMAMITTNELEKLMKPFLNVTNYGGMREKNPKE